MHQVNIHEAKTNLSKLIEEAVQGQGLFMTKYKPSIVQLFFSQQATKDLVNLDGDFCLF